MIDWAFMYANTHCHCLPAFGPCRSYDLMRFLVDRGIDMTIKDYRWNGTAQGWALHALKDEKMAQWLEEAQLQQEQKRR